MSNGNGHRWSKFWWCDWQNDQQLKLCSLAAQGLWMRLLCMMYDANGYLLVSGVQPNVRQIAKITSTSERQVGRYLDELLQRGVARKNDAGVIYCKRMVGDFAAGEAGKQWGKTGGNPSLNPHGGLTPSLNPKQGNGVNPTPYPPPLNQKLEAEEEAEKEPPVGPHGVGTGTPAQPGTPPARRADGTNPRALGTNPRETGANPRSNGSSPRAKGSNPRSKNRFHDKAREMDAQGVTIDGLPQPIVNFYEATGVRPRRIGGANG